MALVECGHRVGCDVVVVANFQADVDRFGEAFIRRVFTARELESCRGASRYPRLAARFAAKEAVAKVLRPHATEALSWTDIEVLRAPWGGVEVELYRTAADLARRQRLSTFDVSISHEETIAFAVVSAHASNGVGGGD
ncbi:holo-[acyl-carrier-protein] synthase [Skermania sp. ID1734]|uniref:holo-ACP synthase n=1 Tax=Skermania sp. ID1734 TaxID=2597516 RepID=UPI001180A1C7|nr:holo-ACP synthase [Skermania sp. ID1734]TSE00386.1 holo-[acyl-carrier-protein] synthase [Skermania sp. ID1734]